MEGLTGFRARSISGYFVGLGGHGRDGGKPKDYVRLSVDLAPADYERVKVLAELRKITPRKWMIQRIVSGL